jgi:hypothetical protein
MACYRDSFTFFYITYVYLSIMKTVFQFLMISANKSSMDHTQNLCFMQPEVSSVLLFDKIKRWIWCIYL